MQPHRRNGRFYNHKDDSILRRLKNFFKSVFSVACYHARKLLLSSPTVSHSSTGKASTMFMPPLTNSIEPLVTWLGHATFLIQVNGINIITDPMLFSGFPIFSRRIPFPIPLEKLPKIDIVLISHNHKDHLDRKSILFLKKDNPLFLVPMGNKKWFKRHKCERVEEKTWWESEPVASKTDPISFTFLPAIHWTSRGLFDINKTLWGSWIIITDNTKIYFAGDTAVGSHFSVIAQHFGQIDVALMPIGPNEPHKYLAEAHMNSDEAIQSFINLGAKHFIPMHWGTFKRMGAEKNDDPIKQLHNAWEKHGVKLSNTNLHVLACGEPFKIS